MSTRNPTHYHNEQLCQRTTDPQHITRYLTTPELLQYRDVVKDINRCIRIKAADKRLSEQFCLDHINDRQILAVLATLVALGYNVRMITEWWKFKQCFEVSWNKPAGLEWKEVDESLWTNKFFDTITTRTLIPLGIQTLRGVLTDQRCNKFGYYEALLQIQRYFRKLGFPVCNKASTPNIAKLLVDYPASSTEEPKQPFLSTNNQAHPWYKEPLPVAAVEFAKPKYVEAKPQPIAPPKAAPKAAPKPPTETQVIEHRYAARLPHLSCFEVDETIVSVDQLLALTNPSLDSTFHHSRKRWNVSMFTDRQIGFIDDDQSTGDTA